MLKGQKHSEYSRMLMSLERLGRPNPNKGKRMWSDEQRVAISQRQKGLHLSPSTEFKKGGVAPQKGKKFSLERRQKMSLVMIGKMLGEKHPQWKGGLPSCLDCGKKLSTRDSKTSLCLKCSKKGDRNPFFGKSHSEESKKVISLRGMGRHCSEETRKKRSESLRGEKHYMWKKDRSEVKVGERSLNDPLQKGWRKAVKNRDGWKCRIADERCDGRLEAHHILPWSEFPDLRYKINNGITLCHFHHPRKKEDVAKLSPYFQSLVASREQHRTH